MNKQLADLADYVDSLDPEEVSTQEIIRSMVQADTLLRTQAAEISRLREALEGIFLHFEPDHLDYVSNSDCGSKGRAALTGSKS